MLLLWLLAPSSTEALPKAIESAIQMTGRGFLRRAIMQYDYLVVGAGLFGSVFAQQAVENGKTVPVIDRRPYVGGNAYSYEYQDTNITMHAYGTHVFHCSDLRIWRYVNRFTSFNQYRHRALTTYKGRVYSMPINLGPRQDNLVSYVDRETSKLGSGVGR
jgi:UDP-galactopyranose mutase